MRAINKALMTTIAACGDMNRNVMCSSLPTMSEYHQDVHAVSKKISAITFCQLPRHITRSGSRMMTTGEEDSGGW